MSTLPPRLQHLPRETRDTLFLLAVIAWTLLPHAGHLPWWCTALTAAMLAWRGALAVRNGALPPRAVLFGVLVAACVLTWLDFKTLLGKEPGVTLAVILMALKTLELRARRDAFVIFFLGFFIVLTHFLYSQSLWTGAAMLVSVWGLLTALVLAHMPVGQPHLKKAAVLAARTAIVGAPLMALLFVMFPRFGPLWGVPEDSLATTGLSNSMSFGSVSQIANDDQIAMRVRFIGRVPPPQALYFRGPVLTRFDGTEWRTQPFEDGSDARLRTRGEPLRYEATLEPQQLRVLPLLEATANPPKIEGLTLRQRSDLQWLANRPIVERLRFEADAWLDHSSGPTRWQSDLGEHLRLPSGFAPRLIAWARALRASNANQDAAALSQQLMKHVATAGFSYTLTPGIYGEADARAALDEFWFDRKLGFCEHYAAAYVVAMRAMGVPARVVTGFQGADAQPQDGYWIVRRSDAHAWAEYWQAEVGWRRADPTAAVAPDRIDRSRRLQPRPGLVAGAIQSMSPALMASLREFVDTLNNRWNQWVLGYSRTQQFDLLKNLGVSSPSWEDLTHLLIVVLSAAALLGAVWAWWDRHRVDPWTRQMNALRLALGQLGVDSSLHEAPGTLAQRVQRHLGDRAAVLVQALHTLERQRYAPGALRKPDRDLTRRFVAAARQLR